MKTEAKYTKPQSGKIDPELQSRLEAFLKEKKISQAQLARILDVTPVTVGAWVLGTSDISRKHRAQLERIFELSREEDPLAAFAADPLRRYITDTIIRTASAADRDTQALLRAALPPLAEFAYNGTLASLKYPLTKSVRQLLLSLDTGSLTELLERIAPLVEDEVFAAKLPLEAYILKCKAELEKQTPEGFDLSLEEDQGFVFLYFSLDVSLPELREESDWSDEELLDGEKNRLSSLMWRLTQGSAFWYERPEFQGDNHLVGTLSIEVDSPELRRSLVQFMRKLKCSLEY
jgi:transcriptional regulator with XRE-family HTH domain